MKLPSERRCPWCGEVVDSIKNDLERYHTQRCAHCGEEYAVHYKNSLFIFSDIIFVSALISIAFIMVNKYIPLIFCGILFIASLELQELSHYEMYDERVPVLKRHRAKINFGPDLSRWDLLKIRLFLTEKSIVPICFADENDKPLSHVICVSIESARKITDTRYDCTFAFLPLSPVEYDVKKSSDFYVFDGDKKRIGKGKVMAEYNKVA